MTPRHLIALGAFAALAVGTLLPSLASAEPPCGRGWRRGEYCGPRHGGWEREERRDWRRAERRDYGRVPAYGYAPPPRPPVYGGPPGVNIVIPLR